LEDRQREEREGIRERESEFDPENPSFLSLAALEKRSDLMEIYISKPEVCQPCC
jgi:hypothetical protein